MRQIGLRTIRAKQHFRQFGCADVLARNQFIDRAFDLIL